MDLNQDGFDKLLSWLDQDREQAGRKYEEIRRRLIKIFTCRGCYEPEDLADETINRVAKKVEEISKTYVGNPALYFYGVARKVHQEYLRRKPLYAQPLPLHTDELEHAYQCLERCIQKLAADSRDLVLQYYYGDKRAKIERRRRLADQLGIGLNALRNRAHRVRAILHQCVENCLAHSVAQ
jgi:DNA-directed RNA polymerase specialized sigma24 family protein